MKNLITAVLLLLFSGILLCQDIEVISPNGGEVWEIGTLKEIKWTSSGVTDVKIEYTANSDTTWNLILSSITADAGSYYWMVPNISSKLCKIRVSDKNNALIFDKSNGFFSIKKLSETEPNNTAAQANVIELKDSLNGSINPAGDIDYYKFFGNTGDTTEILLRATNGSQLYCYIKLYHESGEQMFSEYFSYDEGLKRIPFLVPYAGNFFIRIAYGYNGDYPNKINDETGDYRITFRKYLPSEPQITDIYLYNIYYNKANVQISFYSNRLNTHVSVEYGLTDSYGSSVDVPGTFNDVYKSYVNPQFTGLVPNSTYHVRAAVENDSGTVYSEDYTFNTPEQPENWTIKSLDTLNSLKDVSFSDENNGYAISNYDVYKTTNAGDSWTHKYIGDYIMKVFAINENVAIILSSYQDIWKTTNGGTDWFNINTGTEEDFMDLHFVDASTGFIVGYNGTILKTINGGMNWDPLTSGTTEDLVSVCFINANTGWAAGYNGVILKTTDGGSTWNPQTSGTTNPLYDICFLNDNLGFATYRYEEKLLTTRDGGTTWSSKDLDEGYYSFVSFINNSNGVIVYYYGILYTDNGGTSWNPQKIGTTNNLYGVSKAGNRWIAVGNNGCILRSSFGEVDVKDKNEIPAAFSLQQNYPNPFNPGTKINYSIPKASFVTLRVYDVLGEEVATLVNEEKTPGNYESDFNASKLSTGVYLYKLQAGDFVQVKKMMLMK